MGHDESTEFTRRIHLNEQVTGFLREQAQQTAAYFGELHSRGFTRAEALQLCLTMQRERFQALYAPLPPKSET